MSYTLTLDLSAAKVFDVTIDEDATFEWTAVDGGSNAFTLVMRQDGDGANLVSFNPTVLWPGNSLPELSIDALAVNVLTFFTVDGGTTWYGFVAGADMGLGVA